MACITVSILPLPPPDATHVLEISIWTGFPWSGAADEAVANISNYLSGVEVLGYQIDMSSMTGWDVLKVEYVVDDSSHGRMLIWFKETGTVPVPLLANPYVVAALFVLILVPFGIITAFSFITVSGDIISTIDTKIRADCIKEYIDAGKTAEEALMLCPEKVATDWGMYIILGTGILGLAYVLGRKKK